MEEELLGIDVDVCSENFVKIFGSVNEGLVGRDIHCSWIDVNYESECVVEDVVGKERSLLVVERGIKSLGWGFSSTDAIILGSALVPFGLIYPIIGCSLMNFCPTNNGKKARAELGLSITDVSGKPLECNCCDLELLDLRHMSIKQRHSDMLGLWQSSCSSVTECSQKNKFRENQNTKVCVKEVWRNVEDLKLKDCFNGYVLLRGSSLEHREDELANTDGFFADKVLEMLCVERSEFASGKPIWPVFLNFLYKHKYWALVSISSGDGDSLMGILKPFTVHSAFVCIIDRSTSANNHDLEKFSSSLVEIVKMDSPRANVILNQSIRSTLSQHEALFDKKTLKFQDGKKKIHGKNSKFLQNLSWSSFREAVLSHSKMDLEEVYFNRESNKSKKMKFLKCWMKQTMKSSRWFEIKPIGLEPDPVNEELKGRLVGSEQENDQPVSSSFSTEDPSLNGEVLPVSCLETPEAFFSTISQKIQQGLESKELDLGAFAERLVGSSICLLCLKHEKENLVMNSTLEIQEEDWGKMVAAELVKLLLREPKDLAMKYKGVNPQSSASDLSSSLHTSEHKILFRMEILRSKVQGDVKDSGRKKMVKQICLLLDDIQYHLEGGCFGDVSLDKYVERTIKKRYSRCLGGVVDRIYAKMDLLLCCDDGGAHVFQINSDGDEARRQKVVDDEIGENASCSASTSASVPIDLKESNSSSPLEIRDENRKCGLKEAQERRERASRFSSFTRRGQYLQRVWAPKQSKAMRGKTDTVSKIPKRKAGRGTRCDVVCETPMTEKKRSCIQEGNDNGKQIGFDIKSSGSVSKALFQDDNSNTSTSA
ncbi:LIM domain-containing protein A, putative isoform [Thalictrum thalictroides]|uniref:LIM domain-containing protein A, putative isoform n=1 Tax=Thalictrum thalictroides TaxID=46969 RepID=A0A7J6W0T9_THATH|nr:LIM domain-containing protein A, putative isoform [Thalictrum thalictroides]